MTDKEPPRGWPAQPIEVDPGFPGRQHMLEATAKLQADLAHLYVSDVQAAQLRGADLPVEGVRYFQSLFEEDGYVTSEDRLFSAYVGAAAYGLDDAKQLAREALYGLQSLDYIDLALLPRIETAIKKERAARNFEHLDRLEKEAKQLGQPLRRRLLGALATGLVRHAG